MEYDVIVVGCGVAGLTSAVSAAEKGMKVCVLERSEKKFSGGNTRYTEAFLRIKSETEISEDLEVLLAENANEIIDPELLEQSIMPYHTWSSTLKSYGFTDPEIITSFAETIPRAISFMKKYNIQVIEVNPFATQKSVAKRMAPSGGGLVIVENLTRAAERMGITFYYETTATDLIRNENGEIAGINCYSKCFNYGAIKSKAVILACGGFQGNQEMMSRYVGKHSYFTRPVSPGGIFNKGEGIEMALKVGAAPAGQYDLFHAEPIDPRSGIPEALVGIFIYGILINKDGKRFVNEGSDYYEKIYENVSREILKQKDGKAFLIFDSKIEDIYNYKVRVKTDREPIEANSIKELSKKLGIEQIELEKTINDYNNAVQVGNFNPAILDNKKTIGLIPNKTNWARKLDTNCLFAFPIMCANCFTFGGLKISSKGEVVNRDGIKIPGLYAAGEIMGLYYGSYVGSTSVLRGMSFGLLAGEASSVYCKK